MKLIDFLKNHSDYILTKGSSNYNSSSLENTIKALTYTLETGDKNLRNINSAVGSVITNDIFTTHTAFIKDLKYQFEDEDRGNKKLTPTKVSLNFGEITKPSLTKYNMKKKAYPVSFDSLEDAIDDSLLYEAIHSVLLDMKTAADTNTLESLKDGDSIPAVDPTKGDSNTEIKGVAADPSNPDKYVKVVNPDNPNDPSTTKLLKTDDPELAQYITPQNK